jgi:DNA polymerase-4
VARSHGREATFQEDLTDPGRVEVEVRRLARLVTDDVRREGRPAVRVGLKVRYAPFDTHTRSLTLADPTLDADLVEEAAVDLLGRFDDDRPVRLVGVRAEMAPPVSSVSS